jgi:hypothetical protein
MLKAVVQKKALKKSRSPRKTPLLSKLKQLPVGMMTAATVRVMTMLVNDGSPRQRAKWAPAFGEVDAHLHLGDAACVADRVGRTKTLFLTIGSGMNCPTIGTLRISRGLLSGRFQRSATPKPQALKIMLLRTVLFVLVHVAIVGAVFSVGSDPVEVTRLLLAAR